MGDLGPAAHDFLDWLAEAGQSCWQILPVGPTQGSGAAPFSALSDFAGNPLLVSPQDLAARGWLEPDDLGAAWPSLERVEFDTVGRWREELLTRAHLRFKTKATVEDRRHYEAFRDNADGRWLRDWCRFAALREQFGHRSWTRWDADLRRREASSIARIDTELTEAIDRHAFVQFAFELQWGALRDAARRRGIELVGDLPFYPAHDSVDVWRHAEQFELDAAGQAREVAGVPPDYFSLDGQLWGNPVYRWEVMQEGGFAWWRERLCRALERTDRVRLDHFRAFCGFWSVPADRPTAAGGRWVPGPGRRLFDALLPAGAGTTATSSSPWIAEDLGEITRDVDELRRALDLPGMQVFQFSFDAHDAWRHSRRDRRTVRYTGTHDNDTLRGWFDSADQRLQRRVLRKLGCTPDEVVGAAITHVLASSADLTIIPLQDLLELDGRARMNLPGTIEGNWAWRATPEQLDLRLAERTRRNAERHRRLPGKR